MDASLLQLERELFSLTPVDMDRDLSERLEAAVFAPCIETAPVPAPRHNRVLFHPALKRVAMPAAAAAAVLGVFVYRSTTGSPQPVPVNPHMTESAPNRGGGVLQQPVAPGQRRFVVFPGDPALYEVTPRGFLLVDEGFLNAMPRFDPEWINHEAPSPAPSRLPLTPVSFQ